VLKSRVLRRIFGPRRDVVTREWRKLHNEELHDLYCSKNVIHVIKSRKMRWAGHVERVGESRRMQGLGGDRGYFEGPGVDGRIILTFWYRNFLLNFSTPVFKM